MTRVSNHAILAEQVCDAIGQAFDHPFLPSHHLTEV